MKKSRIFIYIVLYLILFVVLAQFDLSVSTYLTAHKIPWLTWFGEHVGITPIGIIPCFCLLELRQNLQGFKRYGLEVLAFGVCAIAGYYFVRPEKTTAGFVLLFVVTACFYAALFFLSKYCESASLEATRVYKVGIFTAGIAILIVEILKITFGRLRFDQMSNPALEFMHWYHINGWKWVDEFKSFPSGHTTSASVILWVTLLPRVFDRFKGKEPWLWVFASIWIFVTAFARIMAGRHFLSDVMAAFGITLLVFHLVKNRFLVQPLFVPVQEKEVVR